MPRVTFDARFLEVRNAATAIRAFGSHANGDGYTACASGEPDIELDVEQYIFRDNSIDDAFDQETWVAADRQTFLIDNAHMLSVAADPQGETFIRPFEPLTVQAACRVAWLRMLLVNHKLVRAARTAGQYFVKYLQVFTNADGVMRRTDVERANGEQAIDAEFNTPEFKQWVVDVNNRVTDIICLVAYVFRSRGHHYLDDLEAVYSRMWGNVCRPPVDLALTWAQIARLVAHAVPPIVKDDYWLAATAAGACDGALVKRINCAAAGQAEMINVLTAWNDLQGVLGELRPRFIAIETELADLSATFADRTWDHSVNHKYYGSQVGPSNVKQCAMIAAVLIGLGQCMDGLAQDGLHTSPALIRLAKQCPISGSVMATILSTIWNNPRYSLKFVAGIAEIQAVPQIE
jgi:hypothetical protein